MKKVLFLLVIVGGSIAAWYGYRHWHNPQNPHQITLYGNVDIRQTSLAFENSGRIQQMLVQEGETVQAGQLLAVMDTTQYALQLAQVIAETNALQAQLDVLKNGSRPEQIKQAQAQVKAAEAELHRAQRYYQRLQALAPNNVSKVELDNAKSQFLSAQASLDNQQQALTLLKNGARKEEIAQAEAQVAAGIAQQAVLKHQIAQGKLFAPQTAVVRSRLLEVGDMASASRAAYTLALTDPKWVRAYLSEPQLGLVKPMMAAQITTDSYPNEPIQGHISYISSVAEFTPKSVQTTELRSQLVYEIRIQVADPQDRLRLGMPATVTLELEDTQ